MNNQLRWAQDYIKDYELTIAVRIVMSPSDTALYNLAKAIVADNPDLQTIASKFGKDIFAQTDGADNQEAE